MMYTGHPSLQLRPTDMFAASMVTAAPSASGAGNYILHLCTERLNADEATVLGPRALRSFFQAGPFLPEDYDLGMDDLHARGLVQAASGQSFRLTRAGMTAAATAY